MSPKIHLLIMSVSVPNHPEWEERSSYIVCAFAKKKDAEEAAKARSEAEDREGVTYSVQTVTLFWEGEYPG